MEIKTQDIEFNDDDLNWLANHSGCLVSLRDPEYPQQLRYIEKPPDKLAVMGNLEALSGDLISLVGSRDPASESIDWMETYVPELIKLGVTTVSGGARGIDQRTHSLSIRNKSPTVVVLPSGFRKIYPRDLEYWKDMIIGKGGCFVSELRPGVAMQSHYFHQRNRIVVGLSKTLVLVEAKRKSGSSMTGRLALENNRNVCVVPGCPTRTNWAGSMDYLADGAFCVRDAIDIWMIHSGTRDY